ncbi:hypothetical protein [Oceanidesulfovibrio marinus]|uniref:4Fe-4S ferredoxin-type domain-containing protein n=1 Tax=Oceanidesulfovibrio marinus TaxID=370038 RepID=A0ABX6NLS2_9BACT|nr:hypothetical protein [Oceanidesulfovibrio marinus]QJT11064.1 hypothetical protein E8L03_20045 [Oceanidesulfovibrio marinus]
MDLTRESSENQVDASCNGCGVCVSICDAFRRRRDPDGAARLLAEKSQRAKALPYADEMIRAVVRRQLG